jgi:hypothetical protein
MAPGPGIPLREWSGSDATDRLRTVIEENQEATDRQTATMPRLTRDDSPHLRHDCPDGADGESGRRPALALAAHDRVTSR